jgi:hypothetical protein
MRTRKYISRQGNAGKRAWADEENSRGPSLALCLYRNRVHARAHGRLSTRCLGLAEPLIA